MRVRGRVRPVFELSGASSYAPLPVRGRRRWPWVLGLPAGIVVAGLSCAFFAWPQASLRLSADRLPQLHRVRFGGSLVRVSVRGAGGSAIPVRLRRNGTLWPARPVPAGSRLLVQVVLRRPAWVGWIAGRTQT